MRAGKAILRRIVLIGPDGTEATNGKKEGAVERPQVCRMT
jgi:hypothetical protein